MSIDLKATVDFIVWRVKSINVKKNELIDENAQLIKELTMVTAKINKLEQELVKRKDLYNQLVTGFAKRKEQAIADESYTKQLKELLKTNNIDFSHIKPIDTKAITSLQQGINEAREGKLKVLMEEDDEFTWVICEEVGKCTT